MINVEIECYKKIEAKSEYLVSYKCIEVRKKHWK
jgi:hypothetical protein